MIYKWLWWTFLKEIFHRSTAERTFANCIMTPYNGMWKYGSMNRKLRNWRYHSSKSSYWFGSSKNRNARSTDTIIRTQSSTFVLRVIVSTLKIKIFKKLLEFAIKFWFCKRYFQKWTIKKPPMSEKKLFFEFIYSKIIFSNSNWGIKSESNQYIPCDAKLQLFLQGSYYF